MSVRWLATEVRDGNLRWLVADSTGATSSGGRAFRGGGLAGGGFPGAGGGRFGGGHGGRADGRTGSAKAFAAAEKVARKVTITANGTTFTLYDLKGKAAAILAAAHDSNSSSVKA